LCTSIKRGSGDLDGDNYEEVRYEGYGLGGTAIMADTLTDNRNRTVADVRHAFSKHGGNLGTGGPVAFSMRFINFSASPSFSPMHAQGPTESSSHP
jgi:transcriptional/translational regulatory protein YebC/TACO1